MGIFVAACAVGAPLGTEVCPITGAEEGSAVDGEFDGENVGASELAVVTTVGASVDGARLVGPDVVGLTLGRVEGTAVADVGSAVGADEGTAVSDPYPRTAFGLV